ncbi:Histidine kinase [Paramixta manurensis]|uniref:histidine kinase n=1 Tax=Paramixta manurensis TaxID=2740817 RepID=A0A6M8UUQ2_9GAMM|nr:Histidine kinase [Erwiniaceae bacterium PD-1]
MRWITLLLLLVLCGGCWSETVTPPNTLQLLPHSQAILSDLVLNDDEWRWLRKNHQLRVATWSPNVPPYFMSAGHHDYVGISADYLGLIAANLNITLEIISYTDEQAAFDAVNAGEADLIAWADDKARNAGFLLSEPYIKKIPAEVVNLNALAANDGTVRMAIDPAWKNLDAFRNAWPQANIVSFNSARHALEALSFHQIDLFIGDATSTQYLINESNLSDLKMRHLRDVQVTGFSFAARPEKQRLISIINNILGTIPDNIHEDIRRRWSGGVPLVLSERHLYFTPLEQKWIEDNPEIRVTVLKGSAPLSFFDNHKLQGITADILKSISLRSGLKFQIHAEDNLEKMLTSVRTGQSDMIASINLDSASSANLLTTRSYLFNSWVLIGRRDGTTQKSANRLVMVNGDAIEGALKHAMPDMQIQYASTLSAGLDSVAGGRADFMVLPLINASFYINRAYRDSLKIISSVEIDPARFSLAVAANNYPLATILDKALLNIPPEDLHAITRNWYSNARFPDSTQNSTSSPTAESLLSWVLAILLGSATVCTGLLLLQRRVYRRSPPLQNLIDAIPTPLFITDLNGQLKMANRAFAEALAINVAANRGKPLQKLLTAAGLQSDTTNGREIKQWQTLLQINALGYGYVGGWQDITESQQTLRELQHARREAEKANRVKTTFLTTMSHELRTPISAIIGMLDLMLRRKADLPADRGSLHIAWETAQSLLALIGDIIDVARIESGRLILRPERASIRTLIESAATMMDGLARQKELAFVLEIDAELDGDVLIDPIRFKQILTNILGNAIKFTTHGRVVLQALLEKEEGTQLHLLVVVQDSGPGIDAATQARLFKPFEQGENQQSIQGSGLGLFICQTLVTMMGGEIALESQPGIGTEVSVRLRLPRMAKQNTPTLAAPARLNSVAPRRILVVDDHPASRHLLVQQLQYLGHHAISAASGQQALALIAAQPPDVMITDCNMPGMDGFTLARTVRRENSRLVIWGATANAQTAVREACLSAGMNSCLFKPITLPALQERLAALPPGATSQPDMAVSLPAGLASPQNQRRFIELQLITLDEALESIRRWQQQPTPEIKMALHKLRGGLMLLGIHTLTARCEELEQCPDNAGLQALADGLQALRRTLQERLS